VAEPAMAEMISESMAQNTPKLERGFPPLHFNV
jgi:hypothetical protein